MKIFYAIMLYLGLIIVCTGLVLVMCFPFVGLFVLVIGFLFTEVFYKNAKIYEANSI